MNNVRHQTVVWLLTFGENRKHLVKNSLCFIDIKLSYKCATKRETPWFPLSSEHIVAFSAFLLLTAALHHSPSALCLSYPRLIRNIFARFLHLKTRTNSLYSPLSGGLLGRNKAKPLFLHCKKKSIKLFFSVPVRCSDWTHKGGEKGGMGNACYLNREPTAKLNINTDPPTEM